MHADHYDQNECVLFPGLDMNQNNQIRSWEKEPDSTPTIFYPVARASDNVGWELHEGIEGSVSWIENGNVCHQQKKRKKKEWIER